MYVRVTVMTPRSVRLVVDEGKGVAERMDVVVGDADPSAKVMEGVEPVESVKGG